jgi:tubulin-specific chaperone C
MFGEVDDFKWLKSEPSPNWRLMKDEDRVPEDTWREAVPGGPGWRVEDILRVVGIGR